jgi:hypothetical protein
MFPAIRPWPMTGLGLGLARFHSTRRWISIHAWLFNRKGGKSYINLIYYWHRKSVRVRVRVSKAPLDKKVDVNSCVAI